MIHTIKYYDAIPFENGGGKVDMKNEVLRKTDGKLSSYQRMKQKYEAEIRQLTDDIITLVEEKDFMKTTTVKMRWRMLLNIEKYVLMFDPPPKK